MLRRNFYLIIILSLCFNISLTIAQTIKGNIADVSGEPLIGQVLRLAGTEHASISNALGNFMFNGVLLGEYDLLLESENGDVKLLTFTYDGKDLDLGMLKTSQEKIVTKSTDIAVVNLDDLEVEDDSEYSILLSASNDVFENAARYNLSGGRFRVRGYDNENTSQYINGLPMNDLDDGRVLFASWGGLNDVFRVAEGQNSLRPVDFSFGGIGGAYNTDLRASVQRKRTKLVYSYGNRSYTNRLMLTHSSGLQDNGWSYSLSASRRWGNSGYVAGTHFEGTAYFVSIEKQLSAHHALNAVILGSPQRRGRASASVQQMYDIAGSNFYNPNWGYQNGEVRNSKEYRINQPIAMLRHDWKLSDHSTLSTSAGFQWGKYSSTGIDWLMASDPRPDYYKKLPFYYSGQAAIDVENYLKSDVANQQINWDEFYDINRNRLIDVNGTPQNVSAYIVEDQHYDNQRMMFNTIYNFNPSVDFNLSGGLTYLKETVNNYKLIDDLLGGTYYLDIDDFAERDFPDDPTKVVNNLDNPYALLQEGDRHGYDYDIVTSKYELWAQASKKINKLELFGGASLARTSFYKDSYVANGKFPDSSKGKSETSNFNTYAVKTGVNFALNNRNYLYAYGSYRTRAPFSRFAFVSPRTRNELVSDLIPEKILSGEAGYIMRYGGVKARLTGFYTTFKDQIETFIFYSDILRTFNNYVMEGIDKEHKGVELSIDSRLYGRLSFTAAGSLGQYIYTSRPRATVYQDNSASVSVVRDPIYIKNYYVASGPQYAASFTLRYNGKEYWWANLSFNIYGKSYLDINPERRIVEAVEFLDPELDNELWHAILDQESIGTNYTLDFFGGKSFKFGDYYLRLNLSVNNILDNKDFITGGFEQYRSNPASSNNINFLPKLYYAYGRNYSLNVSFDF